MSKFHFFVISCLCIISTPGMAITPSTSCPSGYVTITEEYLDIASNFCTSGYTSAGTATSCLASSPTGSCIMYAPAGTSYTDSSGTYEFEQACPLE